MNDDNMNEAPLNQDAMKRVSIGLQEVATMLETALDTLAQKPIAFVLMVSVDNSVQYIANCAREDGRLLIETQLAHWDKGKADIPGHYNPDLLPPLPRS